MQLHWQLKQSTKHWAILIRQVSALMSVFSDVINVIYRKNGNILTFLTRIIFPELSSPGSVVNARRTPKPDYMSYQLSQRILSKDECILKHPLLKRVRQSHRHRRCSSDQQLVTFDRPHYTECMHLSCPSNVPHLW
jgi:hypothetical protein